MKWPRSLALFALILLIACKNDDPAAVSKSRPLNLILISLDTVRSDYLQLYNSSGAPTPELNKIAAKSYVFHNAVAQVPYTLPSHSTLFTGTLPSTHGVNENTGTLLPDRMQTLAEILKGRGYRTAGFPGAMVLSLSTGIAQGFDYYDDSFSRQDLKAMDLSGIQRRSEEVMNSFFSWLDREKPSLYFAFLHFYDAHDPYDPPSQFAPQNRSIPELYKGELRYVDSILGSLFKRLESNQQLQHSLIVIVGDHGEMLGEHGENTHGYFVYQAALRVPLIILAPSNTGRRDVYSPVMVAEVMPTVLDLLDAPVPESVKTTSLRSLMESGSDENRFVYAESQTATRHFGAAPLRSIQDSDFQYIDTLKPELFSIDSDFSGNVNLIKSRSAAASRMKKELEARFPPESMQPSGGSDRISAEDAEKLASLGYIASGSKTQPGALDAKDLIGAWQDLNRLNELLQKDRFSDAILVVEKLKKAGIKNESLDIFEARTLAGAGNLEKAEQLLKKVLEQNPASIAAAATLATVLEKSGKIQEAADLYRKNAERQNSPYALENYAKQMLRMKKETELLQYLINAESENKFGDRFRQSLGEIYMNLKQYDRAERHLQRAVELNPDASQPVVLLAMTLDAQNRTREALMLLEGGSGRFKEANYYLQLGLIYHRTGNLMRERKMFETMIEEHPDDPRGYFYLARFLLDQQADPQTVIQLATRGLSLNPSNEFEAFGYYLLSDSYQMMGRTAQSKHYLSLAEKSSKLQ